MNQWKIHWKGQGVIHEWSRRTTSVAQSFSPPIRDLPHGLCWCGDPCVSIHTCTSALLTWTSHNAVILQVAEAGREEEEPRNQWNAGSPFPMKSTEPRTTHVTDWERVHDVPKEPVKVGEVGTHRILQRGPRRSIRTPRSVSSWRWGVPTESRMSHFLECGQWRILFLFSFPFFWNFKSLFLEGGTFCWQNGSCFMVNQNMPFMKSFKYAYIYIYIYVTLIYFYFVCVLLFWTWYYQKWYLIFLKL